MTGALLRELVVAIASIIAAHALAYVLLSLLPDAAVLLLGIYSGHVPVAAEVRSDLALMPYDRIVLNVIMGDLGKTLDGLPVTEELIRQSGLSLPRLTIAFAIAVFAAVLVASSAGREKARALPWLTFMTFMPPYAPAFLLLAALLVTGLPIEPEFGAASWWCAVVATAAAPAAFLSSQAGNAMRDQLRQPYAAFQIASGASTRELRTILFNNVVAITAPSFEKAMTWMLANLMFAELVFGLSGLGSMAVRALRRSDPDLILGTVLIFAIFINGARLLSVGVRRAYGIDAR